MAELQTAEFWQDHLEAWKRSGLTQIAYCANNQLHIKSLSRRLSRERGAAQAAKSLTLIPISLSAQTPAGTISLHSPAGWRIELPASSVTGLADLLRQLP